MISTKVWHIQFQKVTRNYQTVKKQQMRKTWKNCQMSLAELSYLYCNLNFFFFPISIQTPNLSPVGILERFTFFESSCNKISSEDKKSQKISEKSIRLWYIMRENPSFDIINRECGLLQWHHQWHHTRSSNIPPTDTNPWDRTTLIINDRRKEKKIYLGH